MRHVANDSTVILSHYHRGLERLDALSRELPGRIVPIQADLSAEDGAMRLADTVSTYCDAPQQIIFLAAPHLTMIRFKDLTLKDFKYHSNMQLGTAITILNRFLPVMAKSGFGRVVFMLSSVTIGVPPGATAHYVTAKYALLGLMKALASEYAGKKITFNAVSPSMVETDFLADIPEKIVELAAQQHPLKRNANPADIAPIVKFLLSEEAGYLTGTNIPVTGGIQF